jgi:hypothetical protein
MSWLIDPNDPNPSPADEPHQHSPAGARTCGADCPCRQATAAAPQVEVTKVAHEVPVNREEFSQMGEPYFDPEVLAQVAPDQPVFIAHRVGQLIGAVLLLMLAAWVGLELFAQIVEAIDEVQHAL